MDKPESEKPVSPSRYPDIDEAARRLYEALMANKSKRQTYKLWESMPRLGKGQTTVVFIRRRRSKPAPGDGGSESQAGTGEPEQSA